MGMEAEEADREVRKMVLGKYEMGRVLGKGTFSKVYYGRELSSGESVAIKVIDKEKIRREAGLMEQIQREIAVMRLVRHPNVVELREVMATRSRIFFVMEFVRGGELFARVSRGRLPEDQARRYFHQLISAVDFCHSRCVSHRDLKPENLLLDDRGNLKVSDFGLSAVSDQIRQDGLFHTFCGTPAYVAPEVLARKGYDAAKADIWSSGVILFVLMAGYLPFHDHNLMAMYRKIHKGEFRCPRWFSADLVHLLSRLLDSNPATRITIPEIMDNRWFKKGFRQVKFYIEDDKFHRFDDIDTPPAPLPPPDEHSESESESETNSKPNCSTSNSSSISGGPRRGLGLPRPASLNAFDIISFSPGFNLSGLFEESGEEARFVSGEPVSKILSKLEEIAKVVSFTVRKKDCQVSLEGTKESEKGPLAIAAEIFELTPSLVVVEVKKKAGDQGEYEEFCNRELKPGLQNLMYDELSAGAANIASDTE